MAIRHIFQRYDRDCGIAVAAMIARVPYRKAERAAIELFTTKGAYSGLTSSSLLDLLKELKRNKWSKIRGRRKRIADHPSHPKPIAVLVRPSDRRCRHWIAICGGRVYDPELWNPVDLRAYRKRDWKVILSVVPAPHRLSD